MWLRLQRRCRVSLFDRCPPASTSHRGSPAIFISNQQPALIIRLFLADNEIDHRLRGTGTQSGDMTEGPSLEGSTFIGFGQHREKHLYQNTSDTDIELCRNSPVCSLSADMLKPLIGFLSFFCNSPCFLRVEVKINP